MLENLKRYAKILKKEVYALYFAAKDPRTPWYAKVVVAVVVGYVFSPIDLIPDFIPVLGYLDDLILVPMGIALAIKLIPPAVLADSRTRAHTLIEQGKPVNRVAAVAVVCIWLASAGVVIMIVGFW